MWNQLPPELAQHVFRFCDVNHKIRLREVCVTWKEMLEQMLSKETTLCVRDEKKAANAGYCFAGGTHFISELNCIPESVFKKMILNNSVKWFTDLMPNLKVIRCRLRLTVQFLKAYIDTAECIDSEFIDDDVWKKAKRFPSLTHVKCRTLEHSKFGNCCPSVKVIECRGTIAPTSSLFSGLFAITRNQIVIDHTTDTINNLSNSRAAKSLEKFTITDCSEDCKSFKFPNLRSFTMTGFSQEFGGSRKRLLTSISQSHMLTELNLMCEGPSPNDWIQMLSQLSKTIRKLQLKVPDKVVVFIGSNLHELREITIKHRNISDESALALSNLSHLTHVSFIRNGYDEGSRITVTGIIQLLRGNSRESLEELQIDSRSLKQSQMSVLEQEVAILNRDHNLRNFRFTDCKRFKWMSDLRRMMAKDMLLQMVAQ